MAYNKNSIIIQLPMKQQLHQQNLKVLRSKYKHLCDNNNQETNKKTTQGTQKTAESNQYLFTTPIKMPKNENYKREEQYGDLTDRCHLVLANKERRMSRDLCDRSNANPQDKNYHSHKNKMFEDIVSEREKQLTERVERNQRILSKSKEVREKQNRNNSVKVIETAKEVVTAKEKEKEANRLNFLFKEKENKTFSQAKKVDTKKADTEKAVYRKIPEANIQVDFTEKLKQNLIQRFAKEKTAARANYEERISKVQAKPTQRPKKEAPSPHQKSRECSIKTPIPFPKESSPSKIESIFANTKKIEERIHALLSR